MQSKTKINWETGTFSQEEPVLTAFNDYLKSIGIHVLFTWLFDSNYLSIYVPAIPDVSKAKEIAAKKHNEIIDRLFELFDEHGQGLRYDRTCWKHYSVINIYSFEISCIEKNLRKNKASFVATLNDYMDVPPQFVFFHSADEPDYNNLPGYSLVFDNPVMLSEIDEGVKLQILEICDRIMKENDQSGLYSKDKIELRYYDAVSDARALYGMSRED
jgi:hypothetical protein